MVTNSGFEVYYGGKFVVHSSLSAATFDVGYMASGGDRATD